MAETLVLAHLEVDASGVAGGVGQANAALQQGQLILGRFGQAQTAVASTTSAVVGRLFNLRAALLTVARSFGVVGLILTLAAGVKTLVSDLVTGTEWFKKFKESFLDWYNAFVKGETALGQFSRKMKELSEGAVESQQAMFDRLKAIGIQSMKLQAMYAAMPDIATNQIQRRILEADLENINIEAIRLADALERIGISRARLRVEAGINVGISASGLPAVAGIPAPPAGGRTATPFESGGDQNVQTILDKMGLGVGVVEQRLAEANEALNLFAVSMAAFGGQAREEIRESLIDQFTAAGLSIDAINEKFKAFGIDAITVTEEIGATVGELPKAIDKAAIAFSVMETALNSVASTLANAFVSDSLSGKEALAALMADLSRAMFAYAAAEVALGIAASVAPIGSAIYGSGPAHFKAAAALGFAGAAAGAASHFFGGGGGGGATPSAGGLELASAGPGGGGTSVSIVVQGSMIGTDENALARSIAQWIRTAQGDGG